MPNFSPEAESNKGTVNPYASAGITHTTPEGGTFRFRRIYFLTEINSRGDISPLIGAADLVSEIGKTEVTRRVEEKERKRGREGIGRGKEGNEKGQGWSGPVVDSFLWRRGGRSRMLGEIDIKSLQHRCPLGIEDVL